MKKPISLKERNLIKGALRRVFARSELRLEALKKAEVDYKDPLRPRVKRWAICGTCAQISPMYKMGVDHIKPVIKTNETLNDLTWDELIEERLWCDLSNLNPLCEECHDKKTKKENEERKAIKKAKKRR